MEDNLNMGISYRNQQSGERKSPNGYRDVKRKLSFISKKIGDLQHQRKFLYKNSAKVKKIVHNQVNQVVKCLRARERSHWADVDEVYVAHDENISEELSRLQSAHGQCQALLEHLDDNKGAADILDKIYSILSVVKFGEKQDVTALHFISDLETMKDMANNFGHLDVDFVKRDEFVFIDLINNKDNSSNPVCQEFHDKKGSSEKVLPSTVTEAENSKNDFSSHSSGSEDEFEIVDLLESMCCDEESVKDSVMVEQENSENCKQQIDYTNCPSGNESKFLKVSNGLGNSQETLKSNDFNPEEEWKKIFEMRSKIADFNGVATSTLCNESKKCETQNKVCNYLIGDKCYDDNYKKDTYLSSKEAESWLCKKSSRKEKLNAKSYRLNKFLFLNGTDSWLHKRSLGKDTSEDKNFERIYKETNSDSNPAEVIRQAFTSYLTKESVQNWLSCN